MKDQAKHSLVYSDSEINAMHVANLLKEQNINPIIKNEFQQALVSGFGTNYEKAVEIWVSDYQSEQAKSIINTFESKQ